MLVANESKEEENKLVFINFTDQKCHHDRLANELNPNKVLAFKDLVLAMAVSKCL